MKHSFTVIRALSWLNVLLVIALDQWSKLELVSYAKTEALPKNITSFFNLVYVQNRGISFGLFGHMQDFVPLILTVCNSIIVLILASWLFKTKERYTPLAISLIIGGAIGNIIDRIRIGAVTDFLDFYIRSYHWPAFNVADSAIFIGVVILLLLSIVTKDKPIQEKCENENSL